MTNPNISPSERVDHIQKLGERLYDAIDPPVKGEPRHRLMLRLGINLIDDELNSGNSLGDAGFLLLGLMKDQLERGGLTTEDAAYRNYPEFRRFARSLPTPSAFRSSAVDELANQYADVQRGTIDRDGALETNGRHAIHLMGFAVPYAMRYYPRLHPGLVAVNALNHDFTEVIKGDVPTFGMPHDEYEKKVRDELDGLPTLGRMFGPDHARLFKVVQDYEEQRTPEQQFTRQIDKIDPYFTHLHNKAIQLIRHHPIQTVDDFYRLTEVTTERIAQYPGNFDLLVEDRAVTIDRLAEIGDWPVRT